MICSHSEYNRSWHKPNQFGLKSDASCQNVSHAPKPQSESFHFLYFLFLYWVRNHPRPHTLLHYEQFRDANQATMVEYSEETPEAWGEHTKGTHAHTAGKGPNPQPWIGIFKCIYFLFPIRGSSESNTHLLKVEIRIKQHIDSQNLSTM